MLWEGSIVTPETLLTSRGIEAKIVLCDDWGYVYLRCVGWLQYPRETRPRFLKSIKKTWLGFEFRSRLRARSVRVTSSHNSSNHQDSSPTYTFVAWKPFTRGVISLSAWGIKAVRTYGIVHIVKYVITLKILGTCITSNSKQYQIRIENKFHSARRDQIRK